MFSVQSDIMGNRVYCERISAFMDTREGLAFERVWNADDRTVPARLAYRAVTAQVPLEAVAARNADLRRARNEVGTSLLARSHVRRRLRRAPRPDALHFHTQVLGLSSLRYVRRIPTVLTADASAVNYQEDDAPERQWTHAPSLWLERRLLASAFQTVFFSEWARQSVLSRYGLPEDRTCVIPPGVDTRRFPDRPDVCEGRPLRVLCVGNRPAQKGAFDLAAVCAALPDCHLTLITNGPVPDDLPATVLRGVRPYTDAWHRAYAEADVFALPTYTEAFGLVYLEAMAAGLPVVGSTVGAGREIVVEGETGELVAPGDRPALADALRAFRDRPARRARMGRAAQDRARAVYDERRVYDRLATCFERACDAGRGGAMA